MKTLSVLVRAVAPIGVMCVATLFTIRASAGPLSFSVDTSSIAGGTYIADFQLDTNGYSGNNTVNISSFGGGSAEAGTAVPTNGAYGDLSTLVTVTDDSSNSTVGSSVGAYNDFEQEFIAGSTLSFQYNITNTALNASSGDLFTFSIFDANTDLPLTTTDTSYDTLLTVDLSVPSQPIVSPFQLPPPTPATAPEPSTLTLMAFGLVGLAARGRWRRKAAAD